MKTDAYDSCPEYDPYADYWTVNPHPSPAELRAQSQAEYERFRPSQVLQNVGLTCSCLLILTAGGAVMWFVLRGVWMAVCGWRQGG